jgi:hypothetical protein
MLVLPFPANPDLYSRMAVVYQRNGEPISGTFEASAFSFDLYAALLCIKQRLAA